MPRNSRNGAWAYRRWNGGRLPDVPDTPRPQPLKAQPISDELPAITPQHPSWIHVLRAWHPMNRPTDWAWECIFETQSEDKAIIVATRQKHRTVVTDKHHKRLFDGHAPMRVAGILRHVLDDHGHVMCRSIPKHDDDVDRGDLVNILADPSPEWGPSVCARCLRTVDEAEAL